jgi:hypothetical protein
VFPGVALVWHAVSGTPPPGRTISLGMSAAGRPDQYRCRSAHSKSDPSVTVTPPDRPTHRARAGHGVTELGAYTAEAFR